ncbi:MAG: copper resistance protein CopC [Nitrospirota bacterium]
MRKLAVSVLFLLIVPAFAYSHVHMLECDPAQDAIVSKSPEKIRIAFAGSVESAFSRIEVFDGSGEKVSKKTEFYENDTVMEAVIADKLKSGKFTVKWICMSLDGHKQSGSYTFTVK